VTPELGQRLEALLVRFALAICKALPPAAASNLGGGIARAIGPLIPVSNVARRNLAAALPDLSPAQRNTIVAEVWENLGRTMAEFGHLGSLRETARGPGYRITGWEHVEAALGRPIILLTGHIGNWELLPTAFAGRGVALGFIYRAAGNKLVDAIIQQLRAANVGQPVAMFPKGDAGARAAYAHLARHGNLAMLNDQKLDNGIAAPFFGRTAMTAPGLASFALRFRCAVLPVHVEREGPARLRMIIEPAITLPESGNRRDDVLALTTEANAILERWIREIPGSWLWLHRRWPKP